MVISLAVTSLFMILRPETEMLFRIIQGLMCAILFLWAATILVGKTKAGRLVLTRRRWKYFTLVGVVVAVTTMLVVTSVIQARPGGNAALPLFPAIVGLFVAQLYEPEGIAQFKASDLSDRDARVWKKIAIVSAIIGISLGCIAGIAGAVGNVFALPLLLPIAVLLLASTAMIWMMLRTRNRQQRAKP
ncbi:hypothetical protein [Arthrobacter sp. efr-133-TYG-118]|uniref:hypothetical protein n=1 Tax=Arthrobacter sp. efr-133-TYG-118 TaxID=3040279 RepID=UPI00254F15D3|nr:hypothetical protein [Arthrobacter sp. efr-133-TYG-118]